MSKPKVVLTKVVGDDAMGNFIDRNPDQMMKYAKDVKEVIGEMCLIIRGVEGHLDACAKNLDDPTRAQITKLHECCTEYLKEIETYTTIADSIYSKGKRLKDIRIGGYKNE